MELADIIRQVRRDLEEEPDAGDVVDWVNRALDDLTSIAKKEARTSFVITPENAYPLPSDFHDFAYVIVGQEIYDCLPQEDFWKKGFKVWGDVLSLQAGPDTGTIELYYYRKLQHLSSIDTAAVPEIEEPFHDLLILYALGQLQFTEEDYDDRPDSMIRYQQRKAEYANYMLRKRKKGRVIERVVW